MDRITKQAVKAAGGASALARSLMLTRQAVSKWQRIPPIWVYKVSALTGIPPEQIRPDMFR